LHRRHGLTRRRPIWRTRALAGANNIKLIDWLRLDFETWFYLPNPNVAFPAYEDDYQHPSDAGIALVGPGSDSRRHLPMISRGPCVR
jgi:hypothetical protein